MRERDNTTSWEEILPQFSLNRRITVVVLMLSALVVGTVAALGIPLELFPAGYEFPQMRVTADWRDSPPKEVLDKIVLPLEEELSTVGGLEQINSWSQTGSGQIFLSFKQGTDMDVAYREVRDRILRTQPRLPDDMPPIRIRKQSTSNLPVMAIGVAIDPSVIDTYNLIQDEIVKPLSRVEGVSSIVSQGLEEKEVLIELNRQKTAAVGLNIYLVAEQLQNDNFSMASGTVYQGSKKLLVRSLSRFETIEDIRAQFVADNIRLSDIATVSYAEPDKYWRVRVNGKPALALNVFKEGQANTIEVSERLNKTLKEIIANPKLKGSYVEQFFSQGDTIEESLDTLLGSGKVGALLAALVLLFFLRRFRLTAIITLSIPLSLILSLTLMYFVGETLNILSLLGLIISVGLLVDNSVVVAENIIRIFSTGVSKRQACIEGASEIALAIILATLTTIIVFLPVALVEGKAQFFLLRMAIPITVSLAASLFVALIFVPLCVCVILTDKKPDSSTVTEQIHRVMDRSLGWLYAQTFGRVSAIYGRILKRSLRRRLDLVVALFVVFFVTMAGPGASVEMTQSSKEDRQGFEINVDMPRNSTLDETAELFVRIETVLESAKKELGLEGFFVFYAASHGRISCWFATDSKQNPTIAEAWALERMPKSPGVKYFSGAEDRGKTAKDNSEHLVVLHGDDIELLEVVGQKIEDRLVQLEGVISAKRTMDATPNELALLVDRKASARRGVNPQHIAGVVAAGLRGQSMPRFQRDGVEVPVRLRFERSSAESLAHLADFSVPTASGDMVALSTLSDVTFLSSSRGIFRQDKRISRRITLDLAVDKEKETRMQIAAVLASIDLPEGIRFYDEMEINGADEDMSSLKFAAVVSILFIYLLMGFLFESFILPLSIIFTIPAAAIGVVWAHAIAGRDLDFLGFVGVILLIGVVVNNGIVFVDYVNRLRLEGVERHKAVVLAAERRFRPIMMTAATTIGGMIPLTLGAPSSIGISYRSFGLTLMGGMATATMLTLLVVPILYTLLDDASIRCNEVVRRAFHS